MIVGHFHEKAGAVNIFLATTDKIQSPRDVSRRSRPSQVEIRRNGAEPARTRVSAAKRILAGEHRSGIPHHSRRAAEREQLPAGEL